MTLDKNSSIDQFLTATAARQPTPGGGSVAALAGALSASIGQMVVNYSLGKKGLEDQAAVLGDALHRLEKVQKMLLESMLEDQVAFEDLAALRKKVRQSGTNQHLEQSIGSANRICILVPQTIGAAAVEILEICGILVDIANRQLLSDLAVCADLAMATVRCANYSVRVNLPEVTDAEQRWAIEATAGRLFSRAMLLIQNISPRIWQRLAEPSP